MAEVVFQIEVKQSVFYDPDKNSPDTTVLLFPDSAAISNGMTFYLVNKTTITTPVIFRAQGLDTLANPADPSSFATEFSVGISCLAVQYLNLGTMWRLLSFCKV